jgi:hypothetical protein
MKRSIYKLLQKHREGSVITSNKIKEQGKRGEKEMSCLWRINR